MDCRKYHGTFPIVVILDQRNISFGDCLVGSRLHGKLERDGSLYNEEDVGHRERVECEKSLFEIASIINVDSDKSCDLPACEEVLTATRSVCRCLCIVWTDVTRPDLLYVWLPVHSYSWQSCSCHANGSASSRPNGEANCRACCDSDSDSRSYAFP